MGIFKPLLIFGLLYFALMTVLISISVKPIYKEDYVKGIVNITTRDAATSGTGTGFFIDENLIVTNYHVTHPFGTPGVLTLRGENSAVEFPVTIVAADPISDITLLRIGNGIESPDRSNQTNLLWDDYVRLNGVTIFEFARDHSVERGDTVYALGHPVGLEFAFTSGVVSSPEIRPFPDIPFNYIQTDADIAPGNSGGPLLNIHGQVIGVNELLIPMPGGGTGFAIPAPIVKKTVEQLLAKGYTTWPVIGVTLAEPTLTYEYVQIANIDVNGSAQLAGLVRGDNVVAVRKTSDDDWIKINSVLDLKNFLSPLRENEQFIIKTLFKGTFKESVVTPKSAKTEDFAALIASRIEPPPTPDDFLTPPE